jgi:hypothetical protein
VVVVLFGLILLAAGGLRLWRLDNVPPAAWIDEAIQGLQAAAMREGERLPPGPNAGYAPMPEWIVPEAVATMIGGDTLGTIRMPAALVGVLAVCFAFLAGRALGDPAAGLGAAAFLMGSFWHIQYCRLALPCSFVVAEGLLVAWLLLGRAAPGLGAGCVLAVLCVVAPYGYAASLITPVAVALLFGIRWHGAPEARPTRWFLVAVAAGAALLAVGMIWWRPEGLLRATELAKEPRQPFVAGILAWAKSVMWSSDPSYYYWHNYPPGAPRFNPIELALVAGGAAALWTSGSLARWQKLGWTAWGLLSVLPEWFGGEVPHLSRGLPQLAPAALAAGMAAAWLARRAGRAGAVAAIALLAASGGMTTHRLVARFAHDPLVSRWYLTPDREAAKWILAQAAHQPVALSPTFEYAKSPVILFYLAPALRSGRVFFVPYPPLQMYPKAIFSDPSSGQPASVVFEMERKYQGHRHLLLFNVSELLQSPERALTQGRLSDALKEYRRWATLLPTSMGVRAGLGLTLSRLGRTREAIPHLEFALSCHPEGNAKTLIEDALQGARRGTPGLIR